MSGGDYPDETLDQWAARWNSEEVVCPYCYYEFSDSWEFLQGLDNQETTEIQCHECDKYFTMYHEYSVHYTTYRKENK